MEQYYDNLFIFGFRKTSEACHLQGLAKPRSSPIQGHVERWFPSVCWDPREIQAWTPQVASKENKMSTKVCLSRLKTNPWLQNDWDPTQRSAMQGNGPTCVLQGTVTHLKSCTNPNWSSVQAMKTTIQKSALAWLVSDPTSEIFVL